MSSFVPVFRITVDYLSMLDKSQYKNNRNSMFSSQGGRMEKKEEKISIQSITKNLQLLPNYEWLLLHVF